MRNGFTWAAAAVVSGTIAGAAPAADSDPRAGEIFVHRVLPTLQEKCFACHGDDPAKIKGELNMLSRDGLLRGGESGEPAIVPGAPDNSAIFLAVTREHDFWEPMPPKENDQLDADQRQAIGDWIAGGAPWPAAGEIEAIRESTADKWRLAEGVSVATSGGRSAEWTERLYDAANLWAYRPLVTPEPPQADDGSAAPPPIDAFIEARLADAGLAPAPAADRRTLIRRVTFDLTGLPPTPREVDAFLADERSHADAFMAVIERLLGSPHYGERMAQRWLDVVRYADSSGYANDYARGNAWRYRDYVIRSFNADKPYDQFVREQIAGDELNPDDPEKLVAVGFLRMGPWELTGMEVAKVARQRFLDDATDIVGQTFLAHMLQCARCHDHKFDPVPTRDYYAMQAVFATTQIAEREAEFLPEENRSGFAEEIALLDARRRDHQATLREVNAKMTLAAARTWLAENDRDAAEFERAVAELEQEAGDDSGEPGVGDVRRLMQRRDVHPDLIPPPKVGFEPRDYGMERIARKGIERLAWEFDRCKPVALSVYAGRTPELRAVYHPLRVPNDRLTAGEFEETAILAGGDPFAPAEKVAPGALSAVNHFVPGLAADIPSSIDGRRAALADWITDPRNPLAARVMANRVWQMHFGRGIAANPNNFGATGSKPTHPQLLDWLASSLIDSGWSIKELHRVILSSRAYQRASAHPDPDALDKLDPNRVSYAVFQPRRLTAEELRDAMLAVTGELNREVGGIPVRPEMNLDAALQPRQVMGTFAEAWEPNPRPEDRHRRSIYTLRIRGQRDPMMEVFNAPSPDISCERREASTVTPQVFALFNSRSSYLRALALADRVVRETTTRNGAVGRAFQLVFGRAPAAFELADCLSHWDDMAQRHRDISIPSGLPPAEVVREAVEENTGMKFTFTEILHATRDFVPDLQPEDVSDETRPLADVCLVLLNANEFVYVY